MALAVAGGGMRGAISAAMCTHLDDAGFGDAFDVVYGCSSGAINAAFFVAQAPQSCWYPLSIYYDDLATSKFVDYSRLLRGDSILDLDYVFDDVLRSRKPLDFQAALDSPVGLIVSVTDVDAGEAAAVGEFASAEELKAIVRAGAGLPLAVNGVAEVGGRRLLDGALLTPSPFRLAVEDGCTHVLSLSTHRIQEPRLRLSIGHHAYSRYLDRIRRGLGTAYLQAVRQRQRDRQWLMRQRCTPTPGGPQVLDLAPLPWMREIRLNDYNSTVVLDRIRDAYAVAYCATEGVSINRLRDGAVRAIPRMVMTGGRTWTRPVHDHRLPAEDEGEPVIALESAL
ncbi:patatin-like phospholipase family protein [Nocardia gipuzkoensis]